MITVPDDDGRTLPISGARYTAPGVELHSHRFFFLEGPRRGEEVTIEAPSVSIGSATSNALVLDDDTVSRHHCEVRVRGDRAMLRDLGSTNGTFVGGVEITEAYLAPGAQLTLGQVRLQWEHDRTFVPVSGSAGEGYGELVGTTPPMRTVFGLLERLSAGDLTCLLLGETGTGKDLAARALHSTSRRADRPFVVVDCGAIQRQLVESLLFGHEKGAFTGADRQTRGAFEEADGGTLFLDEVGDLPLDLQPRLLRVLERREVRRLGGNRTIDVNVRVVAATHRDVAQMVADGEFREDLFYRLSEAVVSIPPLRERLDDVPSIAARLMRTIGGETQLTEDALAWLRAHTWPGNVRELRNVLRRAHAFAERGVIDARLLKSLAQAAPRAACAPILDVERPSIALRADLPLDEARASWLTALERRYLERARERFGPDVGAAAEHVGIHRKSYYRLLKKHGLGEDD